MVVDSGQDIKGVARTLAENIRDAATKARGRSEEDLRIRVEQVLEPAIKALGIDIDPRYERTYARGSAYRGRSDAVYGHLVIEYEPVGTFQSRYGVQRAAQQLDGYLRAEIQSEIRREPGLEDLRRAVGVGLDGERIFFLRYRQSRSEVEADATPVPLQTTLPLFPEPDAASAVETVAAFSVKGPYDVTEESVETLLLYLRALRRRSLTPEALADTFGPKGGVGRHVIPVLYAALQRQDHPKVRTFFAEWDRVFGIVYGQDIGRAQKDAVALARIYDLPLDASLKPLLFAVHTYYALLMKLLAAELLSLQAGSFLSSFVSDLPNVPSPEMRRRLGELEDGGLFAHLGVRNFLEGDFFGWYLAAWTSDLEASIRELARALSDFEPATGSLEPAIIRDLLKKLYQYLVPRKLRHDLGEYYTPDWLAELVLDEAGYYGDLSKRVLDPACGSGTFLLLAIRRAREYADEHVVEPRETAKRIIANIVGFDLNPLAVIAARTNYLLALGNLVRYLSPLEIPVYLCDSVLTPAGQREAQEHDFQSTYFTEYALPSTVGTFRIPKSVVVQGKLPALATVLEGCVHGDYSEDDFVARVRREVGDLQSRDDTANLLDLFAKIRDLKREGRDGIWARIIKNAFAPVFAGQFDYVVGNPPWVRWGYLSDAYRQATQRLWVDYGLFSLKGMAARLGGGEKDFSMLFVYASADNYLKPRGVLGFVITQEVLKSKGAGEGFRRFRIGKNGPPLRVIKAHDLVSLTPFEGASNKTAVLILEKGDPTTYPVPYILWRKRRGATALDPSLSLAEVEQRTKRQELFARPIGDDVHGAWQTAAPNQQSGLDRLRGTADYKAHLGARVEPYGVFWLRLLHVRPDGLLVVENLPELGKRPIPKIQAVIEPDLVFPGVRGSDIRRWAAKPAHYVLVTQDPATREGYPETRMKTEWPETYQYLSHFRDVLLTRGSTAVRELAERTVFWTMYGIGPYTFAPYRVAWKRMASDLVATVLSTWETPFGERLVIGTDTTSFIPADDLGEAHYLCALLNSAPARAFVRSYSSAGRGFGAPSVINPMALPRFDASDRAHQRLSELSQEAHKLATHGQRAQAGIHTVEAEIDRCAAKLWGVDDKELEVIRQALGTSRPQGED
ncbi:MAG: N-6 DNA methylase [Sphaerobacter sp.]|nr:N-6 DNA methylase [Sphaerobacter sp.]